MKLREKLGVLGAAAVFGCAIYAIPGTAHALSCAGVLMQTPASGEVGVPTDTLLWAHGRFGGASVARLVGPDGEVPLEERFLPVAVDRGTGTNFPVLIPGRELAPNTAYSIEIDYEGGEASGGITERTPFTTGSGPSLTPPAPPELVSVQPFVGSGWLGVNRTLSLELPHGGILIGESGGALDDVASLDDLLASPDAGFVSVDASPTSPIVRWATTDSVLSVGLGDCVVWPSSEAAATARFGVLDLAGNFSGWGEPVDLELPFTPPPDTFSSDVDTTDEPSVGATSDASGCQLGHAAADAGSRAGYLLGGLVAGALARGRRRVLAASRARP